jgi:Enoyl-CoA hydratase/carnithine racemase
MSDAVIFEKNEQAIARLTINRPEVNNAFDDEVIGALRAGLEQAKSEHVRILVLQGAGKGFCAGANLHWMKAMAHYSLEENLADAGALADLLSELHHMPCPTICLAHGPVFGGGVGLVAACDIAIAHPDSIFCLSEVRLGLTPATISPYVVEAMGARHGRAMMLTGARFGADEATRMGLCHQVSNDLESTLASYVKDLLAGAPGAQDDIKKLVRQVTDLPINDETGRLTARAIAERRMKDEAQEGMLAFFEKRRPSWRETS